jgi:hypothetical protein
MRNFPRTIVTAAKASFGRRVITRIFLRSEGESERRLWHAEGFRPGGIRCKEGRSNGDAYSIQEIATGDLAPHTQFTISIFALHSRPSAKFSA